SIGKNLPENSAGGSDISGSNSGKISGTTIGYRKPPQLGVLTGSSRTAGEQVSVTDNRSQEKPGKDPTEERVTFPDFINDMSPVQRKSGNPVPVLPKFRFIIKAYGYQNPTGMCHTDRIAPGCAGRILLRWYQRRALALYKKLATGTWAGDGKNMEKICQRNNVPGIEPCRNFRINGFCSIISGTGIGGSDAGMQASAGSFGTAGEYGPGSTDNRIGTIGLAGGMV
ncbi:MAG TPA: hypothetical protein PKZ65_09265, partial [Methanoregulaceae archaeon]|nr:hypothetical protein [Methanoregulaceae archaeon]